MKFDREARRTAAQFLDGIAVALVATLVLAPAVNGALQVVVASCGLGAAGLLGQRMRKPSHSRSPSIPRHV